MIRPIVFGKFVLLERISVGGMAEVYRAKLLNAPHFNRFLAIKRILPNLAADESFIRMFIDEAKITVELTHPNICQIYELGRLEDSHYIAMEYIPGRDLLGMQNRYRRQKKIMSVSQACFITAQVAQGLDFAHRAVDSMGRPLNIVHRDVSPQNVLVSYEGLVKLIDFGVARAASQNTKTQAGVLKGKFGYMSPEQVEGRVEVDHRSDIFALGTVFWELLTGRRLFHADNEFATLELVKECKVELPSKLNRLIPPQIEQICMRALCPDPAYRYQWAGEMARDLWMFLNSCNPPYTQWHLQNWMCQNFAEDLEKEWAKLPVMQAINTYDDVRVYNEQQLAQAEADMRAQMAAARHSQPTLDFEGNIVPELHDIEDQKGERTQVFTPTFDFTAVEASQAPPPELPRPPGMPPRPPETSSPEIDEVLEPTPDNPLHESVYQMDAYEYLPEPSRGRGSAILVTLLVLLLLGGGGFAVWFLAQRPQETEARQAAPRAALAVRVVPDGEGISVTLLKPDGSGIIGSLLGAEVRFDDVEPGRYMLQVSHPEFVIEKREVTLAEGEQTVEVPMLQPLKINGKVLVTVDPPEARVFVGDKEIAGSGATRTLELEAGVEHELVIKAAGYKPQTTTVTANAERITSLDAELEKGVGTITIKSAAKDAVVYYMDGDKAQKIGTVPATVRDLDPTRTHVVEVRARGHQTRRIEITFDSIDGGFSKDMFANLEKE